MGVYTMLISECLQEIKILRYQNLHKHLRWTLLNLLISIAPKLSIFMSPEILVAPFIFVKNKFIKGLLKLIFY